ncbi:AMP-binding protein [Cytobacillus purgationiresistens]|uniref:Amino acid adenylation domain-containing protein n=1 Tax=Cytobacillus purgationiresistens TaxID=863449 RepID=A0ABU0AP43_9BACI|nr:amino acid adenylation domain-containing protein [Cytobacillus purgationiresistens]
MINNHQSILTLIENLPKKDKFQIAVNDKGKLFTYHDLEDHSNRLAEYIRNLNFPKEAVVGVCMERSYGFIVAILGIMKAGAAFLPIDTSLPTTRINFMLNDSNAQLIITASEDFNSKTKNVSIHQFLAPVSTPISTVLPTIKNDQLSYIIYTSGTTGMPKGVQVEHKSLLNLVIGLKERIDFSFYKNIMFLTSISFDIFIVEALLPLSLGLTIVIGQDSLKQNPRLLNRFLQKKSIDIVQLTPSQLSQILTDKKIPLGLSQVKILLIGGEPLSIELKNMLNKITNAKIYNMYGPTEATVWCTTKELTKDGPINIGKPIQNTTIKILQNNNKENEESIGEICILGDCLSRG